MAEQLWNATTLIMAGLTNIQIPMIISLIGQTVSQNPDRRSTILTGHQSSNDLEAFGK